MFRVYRIEYASLAASRGAIFLKVWCRGSQGVETRRLVFGVPRSFLSFGALFGRASLRSSLRGSSLGCKGLECSSCAFIRRTVGCKCAALRVSPNNGPENPETLNLSPRTGGRWALSRTR